MKLVKYGLVNAISRLFLNLFTPKRQISDKSLKKIDYLGTIRMSLMEKICAKQSFLGVVNKFPPSTGVQEFLLNQQSQLIHIRSILSLEVNRSTAKGRFENQMLLLHYVRLG